MSTTTAVSPDAPELQPQMSAISRMIGVFFSPKPTFADIVRKPSWVAPLIVLFVVWFGLNVALVQKADWVEVSKDQIAKSKFASRAVDNLPDEQKRTVYQQAAGRAKITRYVRAVIGWPLLLLFASLIYWGLYRLIGGARTNYATAFSIAAFAHLPLGLRELLAIPVTLFKDPAAIDPENFLASNPAVFLGSDAPIWQTALLTPVDVFGIWAVILVALGFSAADPKKLPLGKSLAIAFGFFFCLDLFFTTVAWIFS
ncbi:MAG TPA: YIP1 family protein [Candidatus Acidoferrum sp.]|nr:YIP1 family protein [Candidatus Acidoferrum sp.]